MALGSRGHADRRVRHRRLRPARYSGDLDIVAPAANRSSLSEWLQSQGYDHKPLHFKPEGRAPFTVDRWSKGLVTIDLLTGAVRDRQAGADIPAEWIEKDARKIRLILVRASTGSEVRVCRPEALWALKLQAGRPTDVSDLFGIDDTEAHRGEVRALFEAHLTPMLATKLARVVRMLDDEKFYRDCCSRRMLGSPSSAANRAAWARFKGHVREAIPPAQGD